MENEKGRIYDLIVPIVVLIVLCILAMLYTGGILEGAGLIDAFANCDSGAFTGNRLVLYDYCDLPALHSA